MSNPLVYATQDDDDIPKSLAVRFKGSLPADCQIKRVYFYAETLILETTEGVWVIDLDQPVLTKLIARPFDRGGDLRIN